MKISLAYMLVQTGLITFNCAIDLLQYPQSRLWNDAYLSALRLDLLSLLVIGAVGSVWADLAARREHARSTKIGGA